MIIDEEDHNASLTHYGTKRHSGRYPWGSGGNVETSGDFLSLINKLRKEGLTDVEIVKNLMLNDVENVTNTSALRAYRAIALEEKKAHDRARAFGLKEHGYANTEAARIMGIPESTFRTLIAPAVEEKKNAIQRASDFLKDQVESKGYIDVGAGTERYMGISGERLKQALVRLKSEGYKVHYINVPQMGTGYETKTKVLTKGDVDWIDVNRNREKIKLVVDYSPDGGFTFVKNGPPKPISSRRVGVNYAETGGNKLDGLIYLRPGVEDVSLGTSRYAQVRILVDGTHYLKGMAVYKDDLPPGVDIMFNTPKSKKDYPNKKDVFKPISDDPDYPFGVTENGVTTRYGASIKRQSGVLNIVNEEGAWRDWAADLSSQMLSKQAPSLAKEQLAKKYDQKKQDLDEIMSLTNPAVRKKLLDSFADSADSSAVHLEAAGLPRTSSHVIIPLDSLKDNEIYAPNYKTGERVVLIRHPHGGKFEIPELVVNNNNREGKRVLTKNAQDAVGINARVAEKLSGADFDGDTVLVIPNPTGKVKHEPSLERLKNFNPKEEYKYYEGMTVLDDRGTQKEMGKITNLITDMQIGGASKEEIANAVRHSMVVIDAAKHKLDYKRSAVDHNIAALKKNYQGGANRGARTLISRAGSEARVPERKQLVRTDPATGKKITFETGNSYTDAKGRVQQKTTKMEALATIDDAYALSSGTKIESVYADHSNRLKALANQARKASLETKSIPQSESAKKIYASEVESLNAKLDIALRNAPRERQAQILAGAVVQAKRRENPNMTNDQRKKLEYRTLVEMRHRTGADKDLVDITDREWEAIQAGAISNSKLKSILQNTNLDAVKERSMPRRDLLMTSAKTSRARAMLASGATQAEVAAALGVSLTTLKNSLS